MDELLTLVQIAEMELAACSLRRQARLAVLRRFEAQGLDGYTEYARRMLNHAYAEEANAEDYLKAVKELPC